MARGGQNRSSAVMAQRAEAHDSLDDFPTPPWAGRALCQFLRGQLLQYLQLVDVREPAANRGHLVRVLAEHFREVIASDVHDYGAGFPLHDYLMPVQDEVRVAWTITNPPYRLAEGFIARALACSGVGVAMLVRTSFLEGAGRFTRLYDVTPPTHVLQFSERVVMHKGTLSEHGSTATSYAWVIWFKPHIGKPTQLHWIGTGARKRLTRAGDYPEDGMAVIEGVVALSADLQGKSPDGQRAPSDEGTLA